MLCRLGRKVVIVAFSAGLISQASAALPQLSSDPFPTSGQLALSQPVEFSLASNQATTFSFEANARLGLLAEVAPELIEGFQVLPGNAEQIVPPLTDGLVWNSLWFNAARIPTSVVPEPAPLALLMVGTTLLYAFRGACHRGRW